MIIAVHDIVLESKEWLEHSDVLEFLGYKIVRLHDYCASPRELTYVIDSRTPEWRGVKGAIEAIKSYHPHRDIQAYNRWKDETRVDNVCAIVYNETDMDEGCFT